MPKRGSDYPHSPKNENAQRELPPGPIKKLLEAVELLLSRIAIHKNALAKGRQPPSPLNDLIKEAARLSLPTSPITTNEERAAIEIIKKTLSTCNRELDALIGK